MSQVDFPKCLQAGLKYAFPLVGFHALRGRSPHLVVLGGLGEMIGITAGNYGVHNCWPCNELDERAKKIAFVLTVIVATSSVFGILTQVSRTIKWGTPVRGEEVAAISLFRWCLGWGGYINSEETEEK